MVHVITRLHLAVQTARDSGDSGSRTARLIRAGRSKMAKKVAEEATEVALDAVAGDRDAVIRESADLLYNLTVLLADMDIGPEDVFAEMERREQLYGIAEKLHKGPVPVVEGRAFMPAKALPEQPV